MQAPVNRDGDAGGFDIGGSALLAAIDSLPTFWTAQLAGS